MLNQAPRVQVDQADWPTLLPFVRLFRGFRMAIHPSKLLLALMLVVLTYLLGLALDGIWGPQVYPGEVGRFVGVSPVTEARWAPPTDADPQAGVFETVLRVETHAFEQLIISATQLNFGFGGFLSGQGTGGVLGWLSVMVLGVPAWLLAEHPGFLAVFLTCAFLLTALFGGAIARLAALQAARDVRPGAVAALRFTASRYPWFVLTPVIPLLVAMIIGLMLAVAGFMFFNVPVLDVIGSLLFGLMLLGGFIGALILIGLLIVAPIMWPALATEGSDAFDAISRAFNYVIGRPWRYLFYNIVMVIYGALTYLFVGLVVFTALWCTKAAVGLWAFGDVTGDEGTSDRFDAILPSPQLGELVHTVNWSALDGSGAVAAAIVMVWVKLLIALLPAYAVSFFFCEQSWIYLLLRRSADGAEVDEVHLEPGDQPEQPAPPEKLEPQDDTDTADAGEHDAPTARE